MFFEHEPLPAESFQQRNPTDQRNAESAPASPTNRQRDTAAPNVPFQVIQTDQKDNLMTELPYRKPAPPSAHSETLQIQKGLKAASV